MILTVVFVESRHQVAFPGGQSARLTVVPSDEPRRAERASRLAAGDKVVIDYTVVTDWWNVARGLSASS